MQPRPRERMGDTAAAMTITHRRFEFEFRHGKIDITSFELRALRQHLGAKFLFKRLQPIHLIGKQHEKLELAAAVRQRDRGESIALRVTEFTETLHHRYIDS